jgi:hypothetical protein
MPRDNLSGACLARCARNSSNSDALGDAISEPACRTKSTSYLVATDDLIIPPAAQRAHAKAAESAGSHAIDVSRSDAVAAIDGPCGSIATGPSERQPNMGAEDPRIRHVLK